MNIPRILKKTKQKERFPRKIKIKKRRTGELGASNKIKKINSKTIIRIYKTIIQEQLKLRQNKTITCPNTGATIKKEFNGTFCGNSNKGTFSVQLGNKKYFVKLSTALGTDFNKVGLLQAQKIIQQKFRKQTNSVKIITPHIIYLHNHNGVLVTEYIDKHEAIPLIDSSKNKQTHIPKEAIDNFLKAQKILKQNGFQDIFPHNAFYEFKTKNILLFDIVGLD
jgi:hypothetical protein